MNRSVRASLGGGVLVVGQEQDVRGGQFSSSESYVGHIHALNVWDSALSADEIQQLAASCGYLGNVMAWPDLLAGINGHIQQLNTSFCAGELLINLMPFSIQRCYYLLPLPQEKNSETKSLSLPFHDHLNSFAHTGA